MSAGVLILCLTFIPVPGGEPDQVLLEERECPEWYKEVYAKPMGGAIKVPLLKELPDGFEKRLDEILPKVDDPQLFPYED